ncbi:DevA family ABC transporter ATP-binding protein [Anthocerotibacter panamensis]|uniref:DevA family ABC transporter ATP-binding protein n=1 Tax=Anthocerotibacter panamensis TaxID=2857077 RepID=UPI001C408CB1|nr:DevA family ABC transporter ATP-binding protein [Anthocerotibacter panamensis]
MTSSPVIQVEKLNHYFGQGGLCRQVLFDVTLEIQPGETVIMTGPSGSGKTTLLTLIGGLRSVQQGRLRVLGREMGAAAERELVLIRRNIGYIFQGHNLLEFLTAAQNVQMAGELHPNATWEARVKAEKMLASVGLGDYSDTHPNNLSGGQKQRVAICRALVNKPGLVLADEPTAALDSKTGREIVELMQQLAKNQGCAILMVTHDNRILDIADRIMRMEDGRLVAVTG